MQWNFCETLLNNSLETKMNFTWNYHGIFSQTQLWTNFEKNFQQKSKWNSAKFSRYCEILRNVCLGLHFDRYKIVRQLRGRMEPTVARALARPRPPVFCWICERAVVYFLSLAHNFLLLFCFIYLCFSKFWLPLWCCVRGENILCCFSCDYEFNICYVFQITSDRKSVV